MKHPNPYCHPEFISGSPSMLGQEILKRVQNDRDDSSELQGSDMARYFRVGKIIYVVTSLLLSCLVFIPEHIYAEDIKQGTIPQITRNPFVNAPYSRVRRDDAGTQKETIESTVSNMKVKGIVVNKDYAVALIGHRLVKTGDTIGEFTVYEISRTGVTLLYEDRVFNIIME